MGHILITKGIQPLLSKTQAIQQMKPTTTPQASLSISQFGWLLQEIYQKFCKTTNTTYQTTSQVCLDTITP